MVEKRHGGDGGRAGAGAGGFTMLHLLGAGVLAFLLPRAAGATDDAKVISPRPSGQLFRSSASAQH